MPLTSQSLKDFLHAQLGVEEGTVEDGTLLFSTSLLDSFSLVDLMMHVEKEGGFRMSPAEVNLDNLDSIERILAFSQRRSGEVC